MLRGSKRRSFGGEDSNKALAAATKHCATLLSKPPPGLTAKKQVVSKTPPSSPGRHATGRALVAAVRRCSNSDHSNFSSDEESRKESGNEEQQGLSLQQQQQQQHHAVDGSDGDGDIAMENSSCSATASLTLVTLSSTTSLSPSSNENSNLSSSSLSCPPALPLQETQKQLQKPNQQQEIQTAPRRKQSPTPSAHSVLSTSMSQPSANDPSNTSFIIDDDQIIARLENECIKLNLAMSRLRKYTQEWFLLETKLKVATEELEAAKEDRDLHYYLGSSPAVEVGSALTGSAIGIPKVSDVASGAGHGSVDIATHEKSSAGIGIPETVLMHRDIASESRLLNIGTQAENDGHIQQQDQVVHGQEENNTRDEVRVDVNIEAKGNDHKHQQEQLGQDQEEQDTQEEVRLEHERVEAKLKSVLKFSPEWFQLKGELVELSITLDADVVEKAEFHDKPKEIEVVRSNHAVRPYSAITTCTISPGTDIHLMAGDEEDDGTNNIKDRGGYTKKILFRPISSSSSPNSPYSPASPRSLSPITPISPPPQVERVHGSISPYHASSKGSIKNISQHCISPFKSSKSNSSSSKASHNHCYSSKILLGGENDLSDDDVDKNNNQDEEVLEATIANLKAQHTSSSDELNRHPQFSKEWFALKTKVVGLEDQIEELENSRSSSSVDSSSFNPKNTSYMSGWSSCVLSESEEEVVSYADDLECVMVAEALNQRRQSLYDASGSEEETEFDYNGELLRMTQDNGEIDEEFENNADIKAIGIASAVKIQALVRGKQHRDAYRHQQKKVMGIRSTLEDRHTLTPIVTIQSAWRRHRQHQSAQESTQAIENNMCESMPSLFDSMLDEFAFMLGDEEDDELEKQHFYAMIIQVWWCNQSACKPAMSMRRRSVSYQGWVSDVKQQPHNNLHQQLRTHCIWQIFSAVIIQGLWRGHCARKSYQVLISRLQHIKSCATRIQSLVRGRRQRWNYLQLREKATVTRLRTAELIEQCQHVSIQLRALASVLRMQTVWRKYFYLKNVHEDRLRAAIIIQAKVRQWLAHRVYEIKLWNAAVLTECEVMLIKLKSLEAAILIQSHSRRWLTHSSFSCNRKSSLRIQAFFRTKFQRSRHVQTLTHVIMIQSLVKLWLIRRKQAAIAIQSHVRRWLAHSSFSKDWKSIVRIQALQRRKYQENMANGILTQGDARRWRRRTPGKPSKETTILSTQMPKMKESSAESAETADKIEGKQEELCTARDSPSDAKYSMKNLEFKDMMSEQDESYSSRKPSNVWLLRQRLERNISSPVFPQNESKRPNKQSYPNQHSAAAPPVTSHADKYGQQEASESKDNKLLSGTRLSVAKIRQTLEARPSPPVFPQDRGNTSTKKELLTDLSPRVTVPEAQGGETRSLDTEHRDINYCKNFKKIERSEVALAPTPAESTGSSKAGKNNHIRKKKNITPEEKMRKLSLECISLFSRVESLPKFSPEWTLSKMEMKLVSEELEYLYAESKVKWAQDSCTEE